MEHQVKGNQGCLVNPTQSSLDDNGKGIMEEQKATSFLQKQITCMDAFEGESFQSYWDRYMELLESYPDHGHDALLLMEFFYFGMTTNMKRFIHTLSRGDFWDNTPKEAMEFLIEIEKLRRVWEGFQIKEV